MEKTFLPSSQANCIIVVMLVSRNAQVPVRVPPWHLAFSRSFMDTVSMLTVYLRENPFSNRNKKYSWHSRNMGRMTHEQLIDAVAQANTTVTKADVLAVITEYGQQVQKALQEGYSVESFFGTLSVGASGSAEKESEKFSPKEQKDKRTPKKDHKLSLRFRAKRSFQDRVREGVQYKTERLQRLCAPHVNYVLNAGTRKERLTAGDCMHIHGQFIKADLDDNEQGVFVAGGRKTFRLTRYVRCTRCSIDVLLPDDLPPGKYSVYVRTKRSESLCTSNSLTVVIL